MSKRASHGVISRVIGESPFQFNELVIHILCLTCTSQDNGLTNAVNVSQLRGVNRTFRDEIDTSLLLWRFMMRFTRRAMIEPPVHIRVNTVDEIKAFILLDSDEFELRDYMHRSGPREEIGWFIETKDHSMLDYREVYYGSRMCIGCSPRAVDKCQENIERHHKMIIGLNRLLGYGDVYRVRKK